MNQPVESNTQNMSHLSERQVICVTETMMEVFSTAGVSDSLLLICSESKFPGKLDDCNCFE